MVKITNQFGDVKRGKQHTAVYQGHYGNQTRRKLQDKKDEHTRGQLEQRERFKVGIYFAKGLTKAQRDFIKSYMADAGIRSPDGLPTTWYSFAKKIAMTRPKVEMETETGTAFQVPYQNWQHRRPITLNNTYGNELTNYQVLITLTPSNFTYANCKSDGSDIRFSASDKTTPLSYYIKDWNYNGTSKIRVKGDSIPTGENICFYLYFGNTEASSKSNEDNTFYAFDNSEQYTVGEAPSKWEITGTNFKASNEQARTGTKSLKVDKKEGDRSLHHDNLTQICIKLSLRKTATNKDIRMVGVGDHQCWHIIFDTDGNIKYYDGSWHVIQSYNANQWYDLELKNFNFSAKTYDIWIDEVKKVTSAGFYEDPSTYINYISFYENTNTGNNYYIDEVIVRKSVSPEPTVSNLGEEEESGTARVLKKLSIHHPAIKSYEIYNTGVKVEGISNLEDHISTVVTRTKLNLTASKIKVKTLANQEYEFAIK